MIDFKVGDSVKVITPANFGSAFVTYKQLYSIAMGKIHQIISFYQQTDADGKLVRYYQLNPGIAGIGFHQDWLELISSTVCRCDLRKLMARGCLCGAFRAEQKR